MESQFDPLIDLIMMGSFVFPSLNQLDILVNGLKILLLILKIVTSFLKIFSMFLN